MYARSSAILHPRTASADRLPYHAVPGPSQRHQNKETPVNRRVSAGLILGCGRLAARDFRVIESKLWYGLVRDRVEVADRVPAVHGTIVNFRVQQNVSF